MSDKEKALIEAGTYVEKADPLQIGRAGASNQETDLHEIQQNWQRNPH